MAGHSSAQNTWRVYSYLMPSDEKAGRARMTKRMQRLDPDVYPPSTAVVAR
jgi:hypothetical protein